MSKIISTAAAALLISLALPALAKGIAQYPNYPTYPPVATASSTAPGVRSVLKTHAKKPTTKTLQGVVKSVSANSFILTIRKTDNNVTVSPTARIVNRTWHNINLADIQVGDRVRVFVVITNTDIAATIVRDISLPPASTHLPKSATSTKN